jgi:hypothetical protein
MRVISSGQTAIGQNNKSMTGRVALIEVGRPIQEPAVMGVDGLVTLAAGVLQRFNIKHVNAAAPVADQSRLLKPAGDHCDTATLYPKHLR